jgi:hypothetical protein
MTVHPRRIPVRPAVLDLIARAEAARPGDPISDEQYFLDQLRVAIAAGESPVGRLRARYGSGRTDRLCRLYARYAD